jgi:hypothetical protein
MIIPGKSMKNKNLLIMTALAGLLAGQLFAASERPFSVINTFKVGYSDNVYRSSGDEDQTFFINDIIDLAFRAVLSDRTDLMAKSQIILYDDDGGGEIYPNLYVMLNHSVSPRLLMRLSEYFRSGEKSGSFTLVNKDDRFNYFENRVGANADYVLDTKNRLQGSLGYAIVRHEDDTDLNMQLDSTTIDAGAAWQRELSPQRTFASVNLGNRWIDYDHRDSSFDATDLSAGLNHTLNQEWQGHIDAGATHVRPDYSGADNNERFEPLLNAGLVYSPSPRTRLTGDFSVQYKESDENRYGGQNTSELIFGAQHDLTAKLMAKATARFSKYEYDGEDNEVTNTSGDEDRMEFDLGLTYKLNRINFLVAGVRHTHNESDYGGASDDWTENRADIGWRVELK